MTLRVSTPADILAYIPHALGFAPAACFVLLTMQGTRLGATLRLDVPAAVPPLDYAQKIATFLAADTNATATLLAVYSDEEAAPGEPRPFHGHIEALIHELDLARMPLRDAWIITGTHWRNLLCDEECGECAPQPLEAITDSVLNATMILHGSQYATAAPSFAPFAGPENTGSLIQQAARARTREDVPAARARWTKTLEAPAGLDPADTIQLIADFSHPYLRDMLMSDVVNDDSKPLEDVFLGRGGIVPDWNRFAKAEQILNELIAAAPEGHRAPMLTVLGWIEFYRGSSTRAGAYSELALEDSPGYRLAALLTETTHRGVVAGVAQNRDTAFRRLA